MSKSNPINSCSHTPVLFMVFNRPDTTRRVFETIREARPSRLYIAADGAREDKPGEKERVAEVRRIINQADWPCELKTLFRKTNLGSRHAVSSAITWFFEQEEQGIILEDDCLPHPDFFYFCEELLECYKDNENIAMISGTNFQMGRKRGPDSYYFSRYSNIWGWASWRRAWAQYEPDMNFWPEWKASADWKKSYPNRIERKHQEERLDRVWNQQMDTWDYQWSAVIRKHDRLIAVPNVNLIANIGFSQDSTHTKSATHKLANLPVHAIGRIKHPDEVVPNVRADRFWSRYQVVNFMIPLPRVVKRMLNVLLA